LICILFSSFRFVFVKCNSITIVMLNKKLLVDVFNDNIYSSTISKKINFFIIGLIIVSTLEIILGTEPDLIKYSGVFDVVYYFTSTLFLIELFFRIYVAHLLNPKFKGIVGKFRFILEFYNLIDVISIMPFVFGFVGVEFLPFLKALRVFRILKILRYLPSVALLQSSIINKKNELIISFQTIFILAVLLSIGLFYAENGQINTRFTSVTQALLWSIAKFIGDIGGYGDFIPVTFVGKILATLNGVLGIAIFALPAGVIGSGFVEEIEADKRRKELNGVEEILKYAFTIEYFGPAIRIKKDLKLTHIPRKWLSLVDIKFKLGLAESDIIQVCQNSNAFRLRNVKSADGIDEAGLEFVNVNTTYGQLINRNSHLTFINLYPSDQPYFGHFTMAMADLVGANYVSNELFSKYSLDVDKTLNLVENEIYQNKKLNHPIISELITDIKKCATDKSTLIFFRNVASNEMLMQFNTGGITGSNENKGELFTDLDGLSNYIKRAKKVAEKYEMQFGIHKTVGELSDVHILKYLKSEIGCDILLVQVNVSILKKKPKEYYEYISDFASIFK